MVGKDDDRLKREWPALQLAGEDVPQRRDISREQIALPIQNGDREEERSTRGDRADVSRHPSLVGRESEAHPAEKGREDDEHRAETRIDGGMRRPAAGFPPYSTCVQVRARRKGTSP